MIALAPEDRLPPQSLEAEVGVIGACLLDESVVDDVLAAATPEDFWRDGHRAIVGTIRDMRAAGRTVDCLTVADEMDRLGIGPRAWGPDDDSTFLALTGFAERVPHAANGPYHAAIVRQKAVARRLIAAARDVIERGYSGRMTADELAAHAERAILAAGESRRAGDLVPMAEAVAGELDRIERCQAGTPMGIPTGFPELDEMVGGFQDTNSVIIAARPGQGKSTLALNFAEHCVLVAGKPALFVSQEMSRGELAGRSLAALSGVDHAKIRNGNLRPEDWRALEGVLARYRAAGNFWVHDEPGRTVADVAAHARRLKARHGLAIVFVDYLQLLESDLPGRASRQEQVARISVELKRMAMALRIPVVTLSQLNREVEGRENSKPRLSDLRESGAIENDANVVILLYQPEGPDSPVVGAVVAKNRNGPAGVVRLNFRKNLMRFEAPHARPVAPGDF